MQRADEKMVFCCNNLFQATCTGLSDIACCWLMHKLHPSPWCLVFIPCKLWWLKKKHRLTKLNIKMQKQNPQCPHCLQCVCSGLFLCYTQLRLLKRAKCVCYSDHFGFSVLSVSQGNGAWGFREGGVRNLLQVSEVVQKQLPKVAMKEKERILHGGARSVWTWRRASTCLKCQSTDCKSSNAGVCAFGLLVCISPLSSV